MKGVFMKKALSLLFTGFLLAALTRCFGLEDLNWIVEGTFKDENSRLVVTRIGSEKFESANGLNVVKDEGNTKHRGRLYQIDFSVFDSTTGDYMRKDFHELSYGRRGGRVCHYGDSSGNYIFPAHLEQHDMNPYIITYDEIRYYLQNA